MSLLDGAFEPQALTQAADVLLKLGVGALIGGAIGLERELHGRPAGIRTHMMMVLGVVLFCEVSRAFAPNDPARIAAQILTGVGFLGAGTILRLGAEIKGLTSAASIWAAAALGMAVSVGGAFFWVAILGTALALLTLGVVDNLERKFLPGAHIRNLQIVLEEPSRLSDLIMTVENAGGSVKNIKVSSHGRPTTILLDVIGPSDRILGALAAAEGVQECGWTD